MTLHETVPLIRNELQVLADLLPLDGLRIIELGCGQAHLARQLLDACPASTVTGLEVDERQHAKNLASAPHDRLQFVAAGAQAVPFPEASFDLALMLKSLHHVPIHLLDQALSEVARVLVPGGHLYVSEPVYDGALNEIVRLFNDEGVVRAAAQAAVDRALARGPWQQVAQRRFDMPVHYTDFNEFEQRMMRPTYADHALTDELIHRVAAAFAPHCGPDGVHLTRPMHVRLLRRTGPSVCGS
jgi:SAM-dependent methyltransferase